MRVALFTEAMEAVCVVDLPDEARKARVWRVPIMPDFAAWREWATIPARLRQHVVDIRIEPLVWQRDGRRTETIIGIVADPYEAEELAK